MKIYLVGGAVRDKLLGLPVKERDWVVTGATAEDMRKLGYRQVGKEFPVFLHPKTREEYALARMERKVKPGYKGFEFDTSPEVTLKDDLIRRDLTINAMAETPEGQLIDYFHGEEDLKKRILRHVSPAFGEDPVRILRVGRFLARYAHLGFHVAPETVALMREMVKKGEVDALVAERVWKELERSLGEPDPESFFEVLAKCGALQVLFPQHKIDGPGIQALKAAATITDDSSIRFATFMHNETGSMPAADYINFICDRYRSPNAYRELALLTARHYVAALQSRSFTADQLLRLFNAVDIFRREDRFKKFLISCRAIAVSGNLEFDHDWLLQCGLAAKSYDVRQLVAKGLKNAELSRQIKMKRLEKIEEFLGH